MDTGHYPSYDSNAFYVTSQQIMDNAVNNAMEALRRNTSQPKYRASDANTLTLQNTIPQSSEIQFGSLGYPTLGILGKKGKEGDFSRDEDILKRPTRRTIGYEDHVILATKANKDGSRFTVFNSWGDGEIDVSGDEMNELTGGQQEISCVVSENAVVDVEKDKKGLTGVSDDLIQKMDKLQGDNSSGLGGVCGIISSAVNGAIAMGKKSDESSAVAYAVANGLSDPNTGGTYAHNQAKLVNYKNPDAKASHQILRGCKALAHKIREGHLVLLQVFSSILLRLSRRQAPGLAA